MINPPKGMRVPEMSRVKTGPMASCLFDGNNGAFLFRLNNGQHVCVICSDGMGWEHVSVSMQKRCPTWDEMCEVRDIFWGEEDCVVQFHPPKSEYVNQHPYCLHLWKPIGVELPRPPMIMVGTKAKGTMP